MKKVAIMGTFSLLFFLLSFIAIMGIGIFIQFKLSRSDNKYLGLIMPAISLLLSIIILLGIIGGFELSSIGVVKDNVVSYLYTFFIFLITNIPTIILGGVYLSERNKIYIKKSVNKMKIEDL